LPELPLARVQNFIMFRPREKPAVWKTGKPDRSARQTVIITDQEKIVEKPLAAIYARNGKLVKTEAVIYSIIAPSEGPDY
jgi:hypothetical protein